MSNLTLADDRASAFGKLHCDALPRSAIDTILQRELRDSCGANAQGH